MADKPTLFADGLMDASVHHGVARITLGQLGGDGKPQPCGQLVVPVGQLPLVANGLITLIRQLDQKAKEAQAAAPAAAPAGPESDASAMPGTFTFGGR